MGTGLYDAVFAALGKLYGKDARTPITNLTLFGGFASTVCWPLSAFLAESFGWRSACLIYAGLHLLISLPLQMAVMPPQSPQQTKQAGTDDVAMRPAGPVVHERLILVLLASVLTISAGIGSSVIVHMMIFLQARGADFAFAVSLGTFVWSSAARRARCRAGIRGALSSDLDDGVVVRADADWDLLCCSPAFRSWR